MTISFRLSCSVAACALSFYAPMSSAQTTQDDEIIVDGRYLYTDQVNALKSPTPIIDVPQSLSIIGAEQILEQGFDSIGDVVLYTPGITQSQGEGHRDAVVIRGVRTTADFFLDGVRDDVQYYRSLYNLEQVEVLRGANALFFGRGGTGGIINRVTKKADLNETFTGYKGSVDTFGAFDLAADLNYVLNDQVAFRVNAYHESLNNHRDFFDGDRFGINPTARIELSPYTTIDLSYEYANNERFVDRGIPSDDGAPAEQLADITFADPDFNNTTLVAHIFRAGVTHQFNDYLKGSFNASYSDFDKLYANIFPVSFDAETNIVGLDGYVDTTQRESLTLSTNFTSEFDTASIGHTIVFGGEYIDTSNDNDRFNTFFDQTQDDVEFFLASQPINLVGGTGVNANGDITTTDFTVDLNDDTEADVEVFSAYIQDEIKVTPWLDLVLGVRFDSFDIVVDNIETLIETGVQDIETRSESNFAPRLGFVLKPQDNISIYGSFSETFLPRSGEQFADINDDVDGNGDPLDPDISQNLEIGVKWDFADRFSFTAAVFDIENSSAQANDVDLGTLDVIEAEVQGLGLQFDGNITDQWHIAAGYSYLDGDQVDAFGDVATNAAGEELRLRELPQNTFNVWNNYQVTEKFGLGLGVTYQGESFAGNSNAVTLPSFTRVDAAAFYDVSDDLRVQVNVENLTDTEYFPNSHTDNNITVGAPINAKFTVSGRF